jgi:hypothetical protein
VRAGCAGDFASRLNRPSSEPSANELYVGDLGGITVRRRGEPNVHAECHEAAERE